MISVTHLIKIFRWMCRYSYCIICQRDTTCRLHVLCNCKGRWSSSFSVKALGTKQT